MNQGEAGKKKKKKAAGSEPAAAKAQNDPHDRASLDHPVHPPAR